MNLRLEQVLFDACLALPAGERDAWLAANTDDEALRARLRRLLQAHETEQAGDPLRPPTALSPAAPRHVGRYRLLERIGEGAMGEVYLAEQVEPVVRRVALKLIKPGMDSREVIARFEQERQTLALMSHPSIAHIIDAGTTDTGQPYFAMEYVPGIPVTRYCDQHRLGIEARLELFLQICEAVQHAHHKGIIHRDLKPGNLLVAELDGRPMPKIIDFGIAKAVSSGQQPSRAHTRIGHIIGTPEYMSPEQAQLSPLDIDTRADVYSLGVVLHELLTGALPFRSSDGESTPAQIVRELLTQDPAAPSRRLQQLPGQLPDRAATRGLTPRQLAARIAGDLDWIVLKALDRDRNRRYGSPAEFAADLRHHLADEPVLAGPPGARYRLGKFATRHRLGIAVAASLLVSIVLFGVAMAWQAREVARQRDAARFQAQRAEASNEFMSLMLEEIGPGGAPLTLLELLDRGVQLLDKRYGADPRFAARMLLQMSRRYMDLENTGKQLELLARAETIARDLNDAALTAQVQCTLAITEIEANRNELAQARIQSAHEAIARATDLPLDARVDCLRADSEIALQRNDRANAARYLVDGQRLLEASGGTRGLQYHAVLTDLGGVYFVAGRFREALELNRRTVDAFARNGRGGTLGAVILLLNQSSILYRLGEIKAAQVTAAQAMQRMRSLQNSQSGVPGSAVVQGMILTRLERWDQALELLDSAVTQAREQKNATRAASADYYLARVKLGTGQLDAAQRHLEAARDVWLLAEEANRDRLADLERTGAELQLQRGDVPGARAAIDNALTRFGYPGDQSAPTLPAALTVASHVYLRAGLQARAEEFASAAVARAEAIARAPADSADVGEALLALANVRTAAGKLDAAREAQQRAVVSLTQGLGAEHRLTRLAATPLQEG